MADHKTASGFGENPAPVLRGLMNRAQRLAHFPQYRLDLARHPTLPPITPLGWNLPSSVPVPQTGGSSVAREQKRAPKSAAQKSLTRRSIPGKPINREIFVRNWGERRLARDVDTHSLEGECHEEDFVNARGDLCARGTRSGG